MFWLEEFAELDSKYKLKLDGMLKRPMRAIHAAQWIVVSSVNYIYLDNFILLWNLKLASNNNIKEYYELLFLACDRSHANCLDGIDDGNQQI